MGEKKDYVYCVLYKISWLLYLVERPHDVDWKEESEFLGVLYEIHIWK